MKQNCYTLICYRSSGDDYCMGQLMSSSDSDFELLITEDIEEVENLWARKIFEDDRSKKDRGVCNWEVTFLINGNYPEEETNIQYNSNEKANKLIQERNKYINNENAKRKLEEDKYKLEQDLKKYLELQARFNTQV